MTTHQVIPLFSDARPRPRLSEDEVTVERLKAYLDAAVIEYEIDDDGDIYIKDGVDIPFWLTVEHEAKSIRFLTYFHSGPASFEHVNSLNAQYRSVQFALAGDRIFGTYYMTYRWGIDTRHIVKMARQFSSICRAARAELENSVPNANQAGEA